MRVDIFLIISSRSPGKTKKAWYKYIMICNGRALEDKGELSQTTGHRLILTCIIEALKRMTKPCKIVIHTDCRYLIDNRMQKWKEAGWKRPTGKLKNADLWQQLYDLQRNHEISYYFENMDKYR